MKCQSGTCTNPATICDFHHECTECNRAAEKCNKHSNLSECGDCGGSRTCNSCTLVLPTCVKCLAQKSQVMCVECVDRPCIACKERGEEAFGTYCWAHNYTKSDELRSKELELQRREEAVSKLELKVNEQARILALQAVAEILSDYGIPNPYRKVA